MRAVFKSISVCALALLAAACENEPDDPLAALEAERAALIERIENLDDEDARANLRGLAQSIFWYRETELRNRAAPETPVQGEPPLAFLSPYESPEDYAENFAAGIMIAHTNSNLDAITLRVPFQFPFANELNWTEFHLADGQIVPMSSEFDPAATETQFYMRGPFLEKETPAGQDPVRTVRARGAFVATLPQSIERLDFAAADIGAPRALGDLLITLTELEDNYASFEFDRVDGAPISLDYDTILAGGADAAGDYLAQKGSMTGHGALVDFYQTSLVETLEGLESGDLNAETAKSSLEAKRDAFLETADKSARKRFYFQGDVAAAELVLTAQEPYARRTFPVDVVPRDLRGSEYTNAYGERFLYPTEAMLYADPPAAVLAPPDLAEAPEAELKTAIQLERAPTRVGSNLPEAVSFSYPETGSGLIVPLAARFSGADATIRFRDSVGGVIAFPEGEDPPFRLYANRIEFNPDDFAVKPFSVEGVIQVDQRPDVTITRYEIDDLPADVVIEDNMVILKTDDIWRSAKVFAFDGEGRFLRRIFGRLFGENDGVGERVVYFYGRPRGAIVVDGGERVLVDYAFEFDLTED